MVASSSCCQSSSTNLSIGNASNIARSISEQHCSFVQNLVRWWGNDVIVALCRRKDGSPTSFVHFNLNRTFRIQFVEMLFTLAPVKSEPIALINTSPMFSIQTLTFEKWPSLAVRVKNISLKCGVRCNVYIIPPTLSKTKHRIDDSWFASSSIPNDYSSPYRRCKVYAVVSTLLSERVADNENRFEKCVRPLSVTDHFRNGRYGDFVSLDFD